jgi:hypothetical protein
MFATGARTEVLASHEDTAAIGGVVEDKILNQAAICAISPVAKEVLAKAFLIGGLEETGRYNLISIYILQWQRNTGRCDNVEFLFHISIFKETSIIRKYKLLKTF